MAKKAAKVTKRVIILSLVILAAFLLFPITGLACSGPTEPPSYTPPPLEDRVKAATIVLHGTVSGIPAHVGEGTILTIQVHQYFKGTGPATVAIKGFGNGADCRETVPSIEAIFSPGVILPQLYK